jgi:transcriptional regulator with XRE-family HTH domain
VKASGRISKPRPLGKLRVRAGTRQRYCHAEQRWRPEHEFRVTVRPSTVTYETICKECSSKRRRERYRERHAEIREQSRRRWRTLLEATQAADASKTAASLRVPTETVVAWLDRWRQTARAELTTAKSISDAAGVSRATLNWVLSGTTETVSFDFAERIATVTGCTDEVYGLLVVGQPGWSRHSDHCLLCGRFDRPHYARSHCLRCYARILWHRRQGRQAPPPRDQRWAFHAPDGCKRCNSRKSPHIGRGLCRRCYAEISRQARRSGTTIRQALDDAGYPRLVQRPSTRLTGSNG